MPHSAPGAPERGYATGVSYVLINMNRYVRVFSHVFEQISSYERFLAKHQVVDTESPAGHVGRGPGAIRSFWRAWRALKRFISARVDKVISLVSVREA